MRQAALTASADFYRNFGARHPLGEQFSGGQDLLPGELDEQTALAHIANIPADVVRGSLLSGTVDEVIDQAAEWRDNGLRHVVLVNTGGAQRDMRKGLASTLPFLQIVRGLKKKL